MLNGVRSSDGLKLGCHSNSRLKCHGVLMVRTFEYQSE